MADRYFYIGVTSLLFVSACYFGGHGDFVTATISGTGFLCSCIGVMLHDYFEVAQ